jgi:deazaflavin-dependent oxidoreductase (nitroreductase family)
MPLPGWLASFNRRVTNRVTLTVAGQLPGLGIVTHAGRTSGKRYRTPVNVFRHGNLYAIALTYGADRDWVRNVVAAGGCELKAGGRTIRLHDPRIVVDESRSHVPGPLRPVLGVLGVSQFMELTEVP